MDDFAVFKWQFPFNANIIILARRLLNEVQIGVKRASIHQYAMLCFEKFLGYSNSYQKVWGLKGT